MNLFSILDDAANKWPEAMAVADKFMGLRYRDLCAVAESLALELQRAGIRTGDKVGIMWPKSVEYVVAMLGVMRAGAIVIPISPAFKALEIASLAEEMAVDAFCYSGSFRSVIPTGEGEFSFADPILKDQPPLYFRSADRRNSPQHERDQLVRLNASIIGFSSGTTSKNKGLILSHETISQRPAMPAEVHAVEEGSSLLWLLSNVNNLAYELARWFMGGGGIVIADAMDERTLARLIVKHNVMQVNAAPMNYRSMVDGEDVPAEVVTRVKYLFSMGSPLSAVIAEAFKAKFGREIFQIYGLSECGGVLFNLSEQPKRRGSIGNILRPGYEIKLVPVHGTGVEGIGEILVRGLGMFDAYYKPWRLRDEVLEDGWFRTGDIARRDADGYYWIIGRVKDVINVGGVKVFPREIEELLLSHPAVEEAMVYGVPEARFGEVPRAKVKLRAGVECAEKEILQYANEQLSVFKALRSIEFVDEIPRTVTGKPRRWA